MPLTFCSCRNMRLDADDRNPNSVIASCDTLSDVYTRVSCPACSADRSAEGIRVSYPTPPTSMMAWSAFTSATRPLSIPIMAIP